MKSYLYLLVAVCLVLFLWFGLGFLFPLLFKDLPDNNGVFGDGFGSANALFSGLGFVALVYTILLQIEERHEERSNRLFETLAKQVDYLEKSCKEFEWQLTQGSPKSFGVDAMNMYADYLLNYNLLAHMKATGIVLLNIVTAINAARDQIIKEKKNMPREYIVMLRQQHRTIITKYITPLAETKLKEQHKTAAQPNDVGYAVYIQSKEAFRRLHELLYEDEIAR